ncbi:11004_t:CDS:1 [Acaulospora morrowiae]|uniref:11004_t:CDS:1 n=1 Tax=Acaulospora morrowiae TaxID=94023 RepID=A0A9N9EEK2_9GLOM|nr:11004_t:CDS:1 [Acaulospora morrowiae]
MSTSQVNKNAEKHVKFTEWNPDAFAKTCNSNENMISEGGRSSPTLSVSTTTSTNTEQQRKKKKTREVKARYLTNNMNARNVGSKTAERYDKEKKGVSKSITCASKNKQQNTIRKPIVRPIGSIINRTKGNLAHKQKVEALKCASQNIAFLNYQEDKKLGDNILKELMPPVGQTSNKVKLSVGDQSGISLDDELTMLNARLMQWCLLNAKAEYAFDCQKRGVETQLLNAWNLLTKKQEEMSNAWRKFTLEKEIAILDETLKSQFNILQQVSQYLEHFSTHYIAFASSLASTAAAMPITNVLAGGLGHLTEEINLCSNDLNGMLQRWETESPVIRNIANSMYKLCVNIKEEIQELSECNSLLFEISEAETIESSLRIQKIETLSDQNNARTSPFD